MHPFLRKMQSFKLTLQGENIIYLVLRWDQ